MQLDWSKLDRASLDVGRTIPPDVVEAVTGVSRRSREYNLAHLRLSRAIEDYFLRERDRRVTTAARRDALLILDDGDASREGARRRRMRERGLRRDYRRMCGVDTRRLNDAQRAEHHREQEILSRLIQAGNRVRQELRPQPVRREVPGLVVV